MNDSTQPVHLDFYFDPLCPWAWMTSLWIREVRKHRPIDITWKFLSLAGVNERDDQWHGPLRIAALARREGGNDAVDRTYLALGRLFHEREESWREIENLGEMAQSYLEEVGLDPSLAPRALEDQSTVEDLLSEHTDAVERLRAFGVPWIVVDGDEVGFFGPVIGTLPQGDEAVALWDHYVWMARCDYLYELKRGGRKKMQDLKGLSAQFSERVPTGAGSK